ncbi:MAG: EAL domain-containing protein, partial [Acidimicrobiia bacterium]|nr:EAL domain-containing protein [Acidimicrobiia bacterium]
GFAGLAHLIRLAPDVIKLDATITRGINRNVYAREMVASIVSLARFWKSHVVAEGIETEAELATLRRVGVDRGQGYLLGRPMPLADAIAACADDEL